MPESSQIISTVLAPAVKLWLRSQLEQVEDLQVQMVAGDRQLLSGCIGSVTVSATKAVYQGLHLSHLCLTGKAIRTNLGQVLRGKPFRLLEAFPVEGQVQLHATDLNTSLQAPLLAKALIDFLLMLLESDDEKSGSSDLDLRDPQVILHEGGLTLSAALVSVSGTANPVAVRTQLAINEEHQLQLLDPQWLPHARAKKGIAIADLQGYTFDLGNETHIQDLTIQTHQIDVRGRTMVQP
jgi:LmeA-like phospholipid-binding